MKFDTRWMENDRQIKAPKGNIFILISVSKWNRKWQSQIVKWKCAFKKYSNEMCAIDEKHFY